MSLRNASYHEAGHALMAMLLGKKNIDVNIGIDENGNVFGHCFCDTVQLDRLKPMERKSELLMRIYFTLAGQVSESILCPAESTPFLFGKDGKEIENCLRHLGPEIDIRDMRDEVKEIFLEPAKKKFLRKIARKLIHSGAIKINHKTLFE